MNVVVDDRCIRASALLLLVAGAGALAGALVGCVDDERGFDWSEYCVSLDEPACIRVQCSACVEAGGIYPMKGNGRYYCMARNGAKGTKIPDSPALRAAGCEWPSCEQVRVEPLSTSPLDLGQVDLGAALATIETGGRRHFESRFLSDRDFATLRYPLPPLPPKVGLALEVTVTGEPVAAFRRPVMPSTRGELDYPHVEPECSPVVSVPIEVTLSTTDGLLDGRWAGTATLAMAAFDRDKPGLPPRYDD